MTAMRARETCLVVDENGIRIFGPSGDSAPDWPGAPAGDEATEVAELLDATVGRYGRVTMVLMPPLVDVQRVELPPLGRREIAAVVTNHGARHFPRGTSAAALGWTRLRRQNPDGPTAVLAAAAAEGSWIRLLDELEGTRHRGVEPIPAYSAWVEAALTEDLLSRRGKGVVCVVTSGACILLLLRDGELVACTRFAPDRLGALVRRVDAAGGADGAVAIIGQGPPADEIADALRTQCASDPIRLIEDPATVAARCAHRCGGPVLVPERMAAARRKRKMRAELWRYAAAGALVLLAAAVDTRRIARDLEAVRSIRSEHAARVEDVLAVQEDLAGMNGWLAQATSQVAAPTRWSDWLATVAAELPGEARLESVAARPGELELTGWSPDARAVLGALEALPGAVAVDLARPIRRLGGPRRIAEDHFAFVVRLQPGIAP